MTKKLERIVKEAEFTLVEEKKENTMLDISNIAEMVMVGRYKDGTEFVLSVGTDDALKAKSYCDYGVSYYGIIIERSIYRRITEREKPANEQL